ncbi:MAG: ATP-binding protein [Thermodesulfobacteriota bacterium]
MHRKRLIWQLYPSHLFITLLALLAVGWYTTYALREFQLRQTATGLEARAHLAKETVARLLIARDHEALQAFCRETGQRAATRLTVVTPEGEVLADSHEEPARMENHADRPEIVAALAGRPDPALRYSHTLRERLMYVAIPIVHAGTSLGILRAAVPVTSIDQALGTIHTRIGWGSLAVAMAVALAAWVLSRRISRPLEAMKLAAEQYAQGTFTETMPEEGSEEVASLARAMNQMASQLDTRIKTIERQHAQLEAVFASMAEGVFTVDPEERIVEINQAGARLLGSIPAKLRGRTTLMAMRNLALQRFVKQTLTSAEPVAEEIGITDDRGKETLFYAHGTQLREPSGAVTGAVLVINDLTRLRRLETMRRDFVANVSHELKTPITSIEGFAETLLDGALEEPEEARRFVAIIARQSRRLHAIIEDLLALSRLEQEVEHREITLDEAPIRKPIQAAVLACGHKAREKRITLDLECAEPLAARINPALMEQAVSNLIDNAIKYSPEESAVRVRATASANGDVLITVRDNGPGIPRADQERIFERFYRVDKARSNKLGSTGLGLAIVKHIVQAHHGSITVESAEGEGSAFTILLPAAQGERASRSQ